MVFCVAGCACLISIVALAPARAAAGLAFRSARTVTEVTGPLGVALENLRNAGGERLGRMASRLQISESYLHYIRSGKKPAPMDFAQRLGAIYGLTIEEVEYIERAADRHRPNFQISSESVAGREALGLLSRFGSALSDADYMAIAEVVEGARQRTASE